MLSEHQPSLQYDLFTGETIDTRTTVQKQRDRDNAKPKPLEMFSQRELAQFGVKAHPHMPLTISPRLGLEAQDPRTDEERERDLMREAESHTNPLFPTSALESPTTDNAQTPDHFEEPSEELLLYQRALFWGFAFPVL